MAGPDLLELACLVTDRRNRLALHPVFVGRRRRDDDWAADSWRRSGDHHLLLLVESGELRLVEQGAATRVGAGEALLLAPAERPDIAFGASLTYREVYFQPHRGRTRVELAPGRRRSARVDLVPALDAIELEHRVAGGRATPLLRHWLGLALVQFATAQRARRASGLGHALRRRLVDWTRAHIEHAPVPADLAAVAGLSEDYFARVFRADFGLSPRDWLVRERIHEAARRLRASGEPVYRIAEGLGFHDPAHFGRQFRRVLGCAPGAWRRRD